MNVQLAAAVLGLSLTYTDMHLMRRWEQDFWKSPMKLVRSPIHWLYIISRSFAVVVQICNIVIASVWKYKFTTVPPDICYMHLMFKAVACPFSLLILDIVLMLRVYALYNKRQNMAFFLGFTLFMKSISGSWLFVRLKNSPTSSMTFNYVCVVSIRLHEEPVVASFV
ncbi:hypothetical protein L218DRAFT_400373 [Marasmius fiardii PR-910]|nr:hypothetical protein L218DRAFT_400373 [Marasmius fiardii PR-910]